MVSPCPCGSKPKPGAPPLVWIPISDVVEQISSPLNAAGDIWNLIGNGTISIDAENAGEAVAGLVFGEPAPGLTNSPLWSEEIGTFCNNQPPTEFPGQNAIVNAAGARAAQALWRKHCECDECQPTEQGACDGEAYQLRAQRCVDSVNRAGTVTTIRTQVAYGTCPGSPVYGPFNFSAFTLTSTEIAGYDQYQQLWSYSATVTFFNAQGVLQTRTVNAGESNSNAYWTNPRWENIVITRCDGTTAEDDAECYVPDVPTFPPLPPLDTGGHVLGSPDDFTALGDTYEGLEQIPDGDYEGGDNVMIVLVPVPCPEISGSINTLPAGSQATLSITKEDCSYTFEFGVPKGDQGLQGLPGEQGIPGTNGSDGSDGAPGVDGVDGTSQTVAIQSIEIVPFGEAPEAVNVGTDDDKLYQIKIPDMADLDQVNVPQVLCDEGVIGSIVIPAISVAAGSTGPGWAALFTILADIRKTLCERVPANVAPSTLATNLTATANQSSFLIPLGADVRSIGIRITPASIPPSLDIYKFDGVTGNHAKYGFITMSIPLAGQRHSDAWACTIWRPNTVYRLPDVPDGAARTLELSLSRPGLVAHVYDTGERDAEMPTFEE